MKKEKILQKIVFMLITFFMILMVTSCGLVAQIPLDKPENIRVTDITEDHAIVIWNSVPNANDYEVEVIKVDGAVFYEVKCEYFTISDYGVEQKLDDRIQVVAAPETSFVDTWINAKKLKYVRKVYYTVWARDAKFESEKNESKRIHVKIEK